MLLSNTMPRVFLLMENGQQTELADPGEKLSPDTVLNFYANTYPILTTASIEGPEIAEDRVVYKFLSAIGTKG